LNNILEINFTIKNPNQYFINENIEIITFQTKSIKREEIFADKTCSEKFLTKISNIKIFADR